MKKTLSAIVERYWKAYTMRRRWRRIVSVLACVVVFCTTYALILPAITKTDATFCGQAEHTHEASCYTQRGGQSLLTCERQEHTHTLSCYSDPEADLSAPALPQLGGDTSADAAAIAAAQLGYAESEKNYTVAPDGETKYGYTCYGAAYGDSYTPQWSALFARYCLDEAAVSESFPRENTCESWISALEAQSLYRGAADYTPKTGDVAFFDLDGDGAADHAGIVLDAEHAAVGAVPAQQDEEDKTDETDETGAADETRCAVASVSLERAVGFGALPSRSLRRGDAAAPVKPTFDLTFSDGGHGTDGERLYYTGEVFTTTLSLSDNAQEGAETAEDDGTVARVYMRFEKTIPDNTNGISSADGLPSRTESGSITANGSGRQYAYTVTRVDEDENHYTYCFEIQRPINGDTLSVSLPCMYPSPTSAGGTVEVWGELLTAEEKANRGDTIPEPGADAAHASWETVRSDYTLTKASSNTPTVGGDGKGGATISKPEYKVTSELNAAQTPESLGEDFVTSITYEETFTLPEGVQFNSEYVEEYKKGNYYWATSSGDRAYCLYINNHYAEDFFHIYGYYTKPELHFSDDLRTLTFTWTEPNSTLTNGKPTLNTAEMPTANRSIGLPQMTIANPEVKDYVLHNEIKATYHYCWSDDQVKTAEADTTITTTESKPYVSKRINKRNSYMGESGVFTISAGCSGVTPYSGTGWLRDTMPNTYWLSPDNLEALFTDEKHGKGLSVSISNAYICRYEGKNVTAIDGTTTGTTSIGNTSPDDAGKYSGMASSDPSVLTKNATITIGWDESGTKLNITRNASGDVDAQTISCEPTAASIQTTLNSLGFMVGQETCYVLDLDLRDESGNNPTLVAGNPIRWTIPANVKDTFMYSNRDYEERYFSTELPSSYNYAYAYNAPPETAGRKQLGSSSEFLYYPNREFELIKAAALSNETAISETNLPKSGDSITYSLKISHKGDASYDLLPLTDHMTGAQVLLAEKEANKDATWASECGTVTVDGTEYYKLINPREYQGVWINGLYADSVTVSKTDSGRNTLIKWYFQNYSGTRNDTVSYRALVCPDELALSGITFSINNESWLNDHTAHRLYDTIGEFTSTMIEFDKKIVQESDINAAEKEVGEDYSVIRDGESVYYRLTFRAPAPESEDGSAVAPTSVTLTGSQLYDLLPLGLTKDGESILTWQKSDQEEAGSVSVLAYQGAVKKNNEDAWTITDLGNDRQQLIWDDSFSVTFTSDSPLYIYIRLTFPSGTDWESYAGAYGTTRLENTLFVGGVADTVQHDLRVSSQVVLQKSVYNVSRQNANGVEKGKDTSDDRLFYYSNGANQYGCYVTYQVLLYNEGSSRLYVNDMQDILPKGFYLAGIRTSYYWLADKTTGKTSTGSFRISSGEAVETATCKYADIKATSTTSSSGAQQIVFHFSVPTSTGSSNVKYDEIRDKIYLDPGEALMFYYICSVSNSAADPAANSVAMPYDDYTGDGVSLSSKRIYRQADVTPIPNDGTCAVLDASDALAHGFTSGEECTQWLYSEVQLARDSIKPGISKRLAAAIKSNGAIEESPIAADPADTLRWEITVYNDDRRALSDYILTDTMQTPYHFEGNLSLEIHNKDGEVTTPFKSMNMSIVQEDDGSFTLRYYESSSYLRTAKLLVNGSAANAYQYTYDSKPVLQIWLTKDDSGNLSLHMHILSSSAWVPIQGKAIFTIDTKKDKDAALENTVYINTCYVTPSVEQAGDWDGTTNHGNVVAYDPTGEDETRLSVRNSAPVVTAYGFATSSRKDIKQTDDPTNQTTCNEAQNYIVLPDLDKKQVTYTLNVDAPEDVPMSSLVFIDTLPYVGDHTAFQADDPRFSEFSVGFADNPQITVQVTDKEGNVTTLDSDQYTVSYSTLTEFSKEDWKGTSTTGWQDTPDGMRTLRVAITDENAIPAKSHVSVRFDAIVGDKADYGQTAWNSFGYHYSVDRIELEAAPLKVGVRMPNRPYLQKTLVNRDGKQIMAQKDETFRFLLYSGQSLKTADVAAIAASGRDVSVIDLTVKQGASFSESLLLRDLKVWNYADGQWTKTEQDWTWTHNGYYTVLELPQSDDPEYRFQSINRRTDETGYQFVYQNDQLQRITAVNLREVWSLTIRKVSQAEPDTTIAGAWFALYSTHEGDKLDYDSLAEKPTNRPAETIEHDGQTWYLARVAQTANVEGARGSLTWSDLRRETYVYQEIQPPAGYVLDPTVRTVTNDGNPQTVTVTNEGGGYELPEAGGPGRLPYLLAGALLLAGAAWIAYRRRRMA